MIRSQCYIIMFLLLFGLLLSATVTYGGQCNITATPITFGTYDIFSATPLDTTGSLNISCNIPPKKSATVTVQVDAGNGSLGQRVMVSGLGDQMLYNLYTDAAMTTVLGSAGDPAMVRTLNKATPWTLTIYGRVPALQTLGAGTYTDLLTATILW